jgi:hypothetical protein
MKRIRIIKAMLFACSMLLAPAFTLANEAKPEGTQSIPPCAIVDQFSGDTQILNETRTSIKDMDAKAPVPCGGWISVQSGWAILQHRFGYRIHAGPGTFAQLQNDAEALVLYRGQIFVQAGGGMGELRIVTPNARLRLSRASAVALFDADEEKSQVSVVDGKAVFENRYETSKSATAVVKSGYTSTLDFKLMRIVPSTPRIVAGASLKAKLKELHVPERESERALAIARNRQKELFASFEKAIDHSKASSPVASKGSNRKIASLQFADHKETRKETNDPEKNERMNRDYLKRKTVGGQEAGMALLGHRLTQRKPAKKVSVQVEDPEAQLLMKQKQSEDQEKKRLIEELSKIRSD